MTGAEGATCVRTFDLDFELEAVKAYLDKGVDEAVVEPPELEPIKSEVTITDPRLKLISDAGDAMLSSEKVGKKSPALRPPKRNSHTTSLNETSKKYEVRSRASTIARLTKPMRPPREGWSSSLS